MRKKGKITNWNDDKGFGFITPIGGGKQIFIHIKAFRSRNHHPEINQIVTYDLSTDKQGRACATNATRLGDKISQGSRSTNSLSLVIGVVIFFMIVLFTSIIGIIPFSMLAFYLVVSLLTFIMYAVDKSAAKNGRWRTSESTLHFFSLIGGWPGALIAQQKLRHKSKKQSFRGVFWVTVLLNFSAFVWVLTPNGNAILQTFMVNLTS